MRETFSTLQTTAHNGTNTNVSSTAVNTTLKKYINDGKRIMDGFLPIFRNRIVSQTTSVADQQYYHYPPDFGHIVSVKVTIGSHDYPCNVVESNKHWDEINAISVSTQAIPTLYFPRAFDFGIYPIPQASTYTIEVTYAQKTKDFTTEDYSTGTVQVSNNSTSVIGTGTTFSSDMVGRWFNGPDKKWYKIQSFVGVTEITLETFYEGNSETGASYLIGESMDFPEELHNLPAMYAIGMYYMLDKGNSVKGQQFLNMFYTGDMNNSSRVSSKAIGGILGAEKRYSGRSRTGIVRRNTVTNRDRHLNKVWATTITT